MTDHHASLEILRWFWTAFFAGFGLYFLIRPDCMTKTSCRVLRVDSADTPRVEAAIERRRAVERVSNLTGYASAVFFLGIAALSALQILPNGLLYAVFCLEFALTSAAVYLQLRNSQPKRVAVLSARRAGSVIPEWVFAAICVSIAANLALITVPELRLPAVLVAISSLITLAVAWRLTSLPALLQGVDLPVETALDNRLRFLRSGGVLILAVVQPFAFSSQVLTTSTLLSVVYYTTFAIFIGVTLWIASRMFVKVSLAA